MGDPRRLKKKYESPRHPWEKARIEEENRLIKDFGLKNKREIWRTKGIIRKYRRLARDLVGLSEEEREKGQGEFLKRLQTIGILKENATLDDVLSLKVEDLLERRLQTLIWKKGIANTISQARQFITHGHISVKGRKTTAPGMIINTEVEALIDWYGEPIKVIEAPKPVPAKGKEEKAVKEPAVEAAPELEVKE